MVAVSRAVASSVVSSLLDSATRFAVAAAGRRLARACSTLALLAGLSSLATAQSTWTGAVSSDWADAANWSAGVPTASVDAVVPSGTPFSPSTSGATAACRALTVNGGAVVDVALGFPLEASGSVSFTGTVQGDGLLRMVGGGNANLSGSGALGNVEVAKSAAGVRVDVRSNVTVAGDLTLISGELRLTEGNVYTLSVAGDCVFQEGGVLARGFYNGTLDAAGDVTFAGTAVTGTAPTIRCAGDWTTDASFAPSGGTVYLDGILPQTIAGVGVRFPSLTVAAGASVSTNVDVLVAVSLVVSGSLTTTAELDVDAHLTVGGAGALDLGSGPDFVGQYLTVNGSLSTTGAVVMDGASHGRLLGSGLVPDLQVAKSGDTVNVDLRSNVTLDGTLTLFSGRLRLSEQNVYTLSVTGDCVFQGGVLARGFYGGTLDVAGDVAFAGTTLGGTTPTIRCEGDWTADSAYAPAGGTVFLDGILPQTIAGVGVRFPNLTLSSGASVSTSVDAAVVNSLTVSSGATLDLASTAALDVSGHVSFGGTVQGAGLLRTVGGGNSNLSGSGALGNVEVAKSAAGVRVDVRSNVTVAGDLTLISGELRLTEGNVYTLSVAGDCVFQEGGVLARGFYNGTLDAAGDVTFAGTAVTGTAPTIRCAGDWTTDASFAPSGGTVYLDGILPQTIAGVGVRFPSLTVAAGASVSTNVDVLVAVSLVVSGSLTTTAELDVDAHLTVGGAGALDLGSGPDFVGQYLTVNGSLSTTGAVVMDGASHGRLLGSGLVPDLQVAKSGDTVNVDLRSNVTLDGTLTLFSGRLRLSEQNVYTLSVTGDCVFQGGVLARGFYGGTLDVGGDVAFAGTTLGGTTPTIRCEGDWTADSAYAPTGGTVFLDGSLPQTIAGVGVRFPNLTLASNAAVSTAVDVAVVASLTVSSGATLDLAAAATLDVSGHVSFSGTVQGAGLLRMVGGSTSNLSGPGSLGNVEVAKSAAGVRVDVRSNVTVAGDLTLISGELRLTEGNVYTLSVAGDCVFQEGGVLARGFYNGTLDAAGDVTFAGTAVTGTAPTIRCAGDWTTDASFAPSGGTVYLDGILPQTIAGVGVRFPSLTVAAGASVSTNVDVLVAVSLVVSGSLTTTAELDVDAHLTVGGAGALDLGSGPDFVGQYLTVNGSLSTTGAVVMDGASHGRLLGSGLVPDLQVAKSGDTVNVDLRSNVTLDGTLTLFSGRLRLSEQNVYTLSVTGDCVFQGGVLARGFYGGTLDVGGDVAFAGTTLGGTTPTIRCEGDWTADSAYAPTGGTVFLDGSLPQTIAGVGVRFPNLTLTSNAAVSTAVDVAVVASLTVSSGATLDLAAAATLDVSGHVSFSGTVQGAGLLRMVGGSTSNLSGPGSLGNVEVAKSAAGVRVDVRSNVAVAGDLTLSTGQLRLTEGSTYTLSVAGDCAFTGGALARGFYLGTLDVAGDVTFSGTSVTGTAPTIRCAGDWTGDPSFAPSGGSVYLDGAASTVLAAVVPGDSLTFPTLVLQNGLRQAGNDLSVGANQITVASSASLSVEGATLEITSGGLTLNGDLSVGPAGVLGLHSGLALNVPGGVTLSLIGAPGSPAVITSAGAAGYGLTINGTIAASNFAFANMGPAGIVIPTGATIAPAPDNLNGGSYSNPFAAAGSALLDVERAAPTEIRYAGFPDTPIPGVFNVRTSAGSAPITFVNYGGPFAGAGFEDDPGAGPEGNLIWAPDDRTELASFTATPGIEQVTLDWTTVSEVDVAAFVIERSTSPGGPFTQVAEVPPAGPSAYQVVDGGLTGGVPYYYQLSERLQTIGELRLLGTAGATPSEPASTLAFGTPPTSPVTAGDPWTAFTVRIEDDFGNLQPGATNPVTLVQTGGPGVIGGVLTHDAVAGIATFDGLSATVAGGYTFDLTSPGLTPILGATVAVDPAVAVALVFETPPSPTAVVGLLWDPFTVRLEDAYGNLATSSTDTVSLILTAGTGFLSGSVSQPAAGGRVTFGDLAYDVAETVDFDVFSASLAGLPSNQVVVVPFDSDLRIADDGLRFTPAAPAVGELTLLEIGVLNAGQVNTTADVSFYLGNPDLGGTLLGQVLAAPVGVGTEAALGITWSPTGAGLQGIFAVVENLTPPDSTPGDNQTTRQLSVGAAPEALAVSTGERVAWPGAVSSVPVTITNVGAGAATITGVSTSGQPWLTFVTPLVGETLDPGESRIALAELSVPGTASGAPLGELPLVESITVTIETAGDGFSDILLVKLFDQPAGTLTLTVVDDATSAPLQDAIVTAQDLPGSFLTDAAGQVVLSLPPGPRSVFAYKSGYVAAAGTTEVLEGGSALEVRLVAGNTLEVEQILVEELTTQEILDRGISPDDPVNNAIFDFTVAMRIGPPIYVPSIELERAPAPGTQVTFVTTGYGGGGGGGLGGDAVAGATVWNVTTTFVYNDYGRTETWIIVPGQVMVLKEFLEATIVVVNNAVADPPEDVQLDNVTATLDVPSGLALPDLDGAPQSPAQTLPLLSAGESAQAVWTLRGDEPGFYTLEGTVTADLLAFGEPVPGGSLVANAVSDPFEVTTPRIRCEFVTPGAVTAGASFPFGVVVYNENSRVANLVRVTIKEEDLLNCTIDDLQPEATLTLGTGGQILSAQVDLGDIDPGGFGQADFSLISLVTGTVQEVLVDCNCGGEPTRPVEVVPDPPLIVAQPADTSACDGTAASFTVVASGAEPITYQWRHDGGDIPGATLATLLIDPVSPADAGTYTVQVTNEGGAVLSAGATLSVELPPIITADPASQVVCSGLPVDLTVTATGTAPLAYQWYRNGEILPGETAATYSILAASPADAGNYTVEVSNGCDTVVSATAVLDVQTPPAITADPQPQTVCETEPVTLSVTATGAGPLSYQWRRDGEDLPGANADTYQIPSAGASDDGSYDVLVSGTCGSVASAAAVVAVQFPPVINSSPQSQTVCETAPVTLSVLATGTAPLSYQWRKDGVDISGATADSYLIPSATVADAGSYDVVVSNACDSATSGAALLAVEEPPAITAHPISQTECTGTQVTFSVTAAGSAPLTYQWRKGGVDVPGATGASLVLPAITLADAGSYDVVVANGCDSATSDPATLVVDEPPSIDAHPISQTECTGTQVTFTVTASGAAPLSYQWRKGGVDVPGATGASLVLPSVTLADAGSYDVVVTNACDSATSDPATLVVDEPPSITAHPVSQTECTGTQVTFTVTASGAAPLSYQWRKGGVDVPGATGASLVLPAITLADAGSYDVVVTNACDSATSDPATLVVDEPPTIDAHPVSQTECTGTQVTFTVTASGAAPLSYQWRKGGVDVPGATGASLVLPSVTLADAGGYDVVVTNACDSATSDPATLVVDEPPAIDAQPVSQTECTGTQVTFTVTATGTAPLSYQWRKDGVDISGATDASLVLPAITLADAGGYDVVVTNACDSATSDPATLVVDEPPSITAQPVSQTECTGTQVTFTVTATGTAPLSYQWRKDGVDISGATDASLVLPAITLADAGGYDVVVTNACDSATSDPATLVVDEPPAIDAQPVSQTECTGTQVTFTVTASGSAPLTYQWRKDGVDIPGATDASLVLPSVTLADAGAYDVVVANGCDSATSDPASLVVDEPPAIDAHPVSQTECTGTQVTFTVTASGAAPLTYQWRKDGGDIPDATDASLVLPAITLADAGSYDVVVTNHCDSTASAPAVLTVEEPPVVTVDPQSQTVCELEPVTLSVTATGTGPLSYQWYAGLDPIPGATSDAYSIPSATLADGGSYTVEVSNDCGTVTSAAALLTVHSPPAITAHPQPQTVLVGDQVVFSVVATGTEPLSYQWYKDGAALAGETADVLTIPTVEAADAGTYHVEVTNDCDTIASFPATLTVGDGAPIVVTDPEDLVLPVGDTAVFTVVAEGAAPLTYQWRKDGVDIPGTNSDTLTILLVDFDDEGFYDVVVSNGYGEATSATAQLSVLCTTCDEVLVIDQDAVVDFNSTPPIYTGDPDLAPFFSYDVSGPTPDKWRAIFDVGNRKVLVLAGARITAANVVGPQDERVPGIEIFACELEVEAGGAIEIDDETLHKAGDFLFQVEGDVRIAGDVRKRVTPPSGFPGSITIASNCGGIWTGPESSVLIEGSTPGARALNLLACGPGADIVILGLVAAKDLGGYEPEINVIAYDGAVTIDGTTLHSSHPETGRLFTSGVLVWSSQSPHPGTLNIQAQGDITVIGNASLSTDPFVDNFGAVAAKTDQHSSVGGYLDVRSLAGRLVATDRAFDNANKPNATAVIQLFAAGDVDLSVTAAVNAGAGDNKKRVVTTNVTGNGAAGTNIIRSYSGTIFVGENAIVMAVPDNHGADGDNFLTFCTDLQLHPACEFEPDPDITGPVCTPSAPDAIYLDWAGFGISFD